MSLKAPVWWCSLYTRKQVKSEQDTRQLKEMLFPESWCRVYNDLRDCQLEIVPFLTSCRGDWNGVFSLYSWKQILRNGETPFSYSSTNLSEAGAGGGGELGTLTHVPWERREAQRLWERVWQFLRKLTTELLCDSIMPQLETCPRSWRLKSAQKPAHKCSHAFIRMGQFGSKHPSTDG